MKLIHYLLVTDKATCNAYLSSLVQHRNMHMVGCASSGERALLMAVTFKPHVIVLDLDLLPAHALQLIRYIRKHADTKCTRILSLCSTSGRGALLQAQDESDCCLIKPVHADQLIAHIQTLGLTAISTPFEYLITTVLLQLGVPSHLHGYQYIRTALISLEENPELLYHMMHGLYPIIAKQHHTRISNVERSIRNAITQTWNRGGAEPYHRLLGLHSNFIVEKPTNSEFLAYVSECLHLQWERCQATGVNWYDTLL